MRGVVATALLAVCPPSGLARAAEAGGVDDPEKLAEIGIEHLLDLRVEQVYGASRYLQTATEAPASVNIITAQDIRNYGYRTLAEVLRSVRGLYVTYDRNYSNLGIRGFGRPGDFNTRMLLLVDGHRMNDNLYDSALIGAEALLDLELIERVEIIRGPGSSLYGSNAFFGVINVVTRKGGQIRALEIAADAGSFASHRERMTYGTQLENGLEWTLSGSHSGSDGQRALYYPEFDAPESNNGVAEDADAESARNFHGSAAYRDLTLAAGYSQRDKEIPTASFGTHFNDGRERSTDERYYVSAGYARNVLINTRLASRLYYDYYGYHADYPYNYAPPGDPPDVRVSHDHNYGEGVGLELQLTRAITDRHLVIAGGEVRESLHLYQANYNDDQSYNFEDDRRAHAFGLYAQDEFSFAGGFTVVTGLRYDHSTNFGGALSPRFALIAAPWHGGTAKLLFGQAYRAPNAYELYVESVGFSKPNPDLGAEKIRTYELVLEQYATGRFRLIGSVYRNDIRHLISQEIDPADGLAVFANRDHVRGEGAELGLQALAAGGWSARASYALQRTRDRTTDQELSNSPRHLGKANLTAPVGTKRLLAAVELQHASSSRTIAGGHTASFTLANLTLTALQLLPQLEVSASVMNALDRAYAYPGSTGHRQEAIPQDGRSVRLKATYRFGPHRDIE